MSSPLPSSPNLIAYPIRANPQADDLPTESILSPSQLTFGGLCGICAGVFVKKGAKLVAFTLGAGYVLMQVSCRRRDVALAGPPSYSISDIE